MRKPSTIDKYEYGARFSQFMAKLPSITPDIKEELKSFLQHIQLFYIEAAKQIKQRFSIDDNNYSEIPTHP